MVFVINILVLIGFVYLMWLMLASPIRVIRRLGAAMGLLIIMPFWGLQAWPPFVKTILALSAIAGSIWVSVRSGHQPAWLRVRWVGFLYFGLLMLMIFIWSVFSESPTLSLPALGVPAVVAAFCLFRKIWVERFTQVSGRSNHA